jgi:hypothetical protein
MLRHKDPSQQVESVFSVRDTDGICEEHLRGFTFQERLPLVAGESQLMDVARVIVPVTGFSFGKILRHGVFNSRNSEETAPGERLASIQTKLAAEN